MMKKKIVSKSAKYYAMMKKKIVSKSSLTCWGVESKQIMKTREDIPDHRLFKCTRSFSTYFFSIFV